MIAAVNDATETDSFSARELAAIARVPNGTMNGWLSDRRAFPRVEIGARGKRTYGREALKRLAIYMAATSGGLGMDAGDVKLLITQVGVEDAWGYYVRGMSELASFLVDRRDTLLGG